MGIFKKWLNVNQLNENANINQLNHRLRTLFYCACVRQIWNKLTDQRSKDAIIISELYVDGKATRKELEKAKTAAHYAANAAYAAAWDATYAAATAAYYAAYYATYAVDIINWIERAGCNKEIQNELLNVIIDENLNYSLEWNSSNVVNLAKRIYDNQEWETMLILADALQDMDCDQIELLEKMRNPNQVWCLGCKILDEILKKR